MAVYDFFLSRNNGPTVNTYIGHAGRLFYDNAERVLRISDGVTPGGEIFNGYVSVLETEPTQPFQGQVWLNPDTFELSIYHNGDFIPTIDVATETKLGGVRLGPGVTTNSEGQIIIDSTGLDFSFGDFAAIIGLYSNSTEYALLSSVKPDEDIVFASNGDGDIKVVGGFSIYATNGSITGSLESAPVLNVSADGDISARSLDIQETGDLGLMAALNVTINADGLTKTPTVVSGSVAQFTGRDDRTAILVVDTYGNDINNTLTGGQLTFRTGRGTNASTTAVQSGDRLGEVTAAGWASNGYGGIGVGGYRILANENFTATARGSKLELFVTPNGTITPTVIVTVDSTGITMASGKTITGDVIGNVSGTAGSVVNALTAGTYLTSGGTYNGGTARTFAVDATTTNTVSKVVARDANGDFAARHISAKIKHATRNAGSVNGGLTIDYNTDDWIVGDFTTAFTITHSNLSAGMDATVVLYNSSGFGEDIITIGVGTENTTIQTNTITVNDTNLIILKFYSFGTTTADLYCNISYTNVE